MRFDANFIFPLNMAFCHLRAATKSRPAGRRRVIRLLSSVFRHLPSVIRHLLALRSLEGEAGSSVFCRPSSVICHLPSVFCLPCVAWKAKQGHPSSAVCLPCVAWRAKQGHPSPKRRLRIQGPVVVQKFDFGPCGPIIQRLRIEIRSHIFLNRS